MPGTRTPSQETVDNTVAIGQLTVISERTTKDVDRLVKHIEKILPIHEKLSNLKKILYSTITLIFAFCCWISLEHFDLKSNFHSLEKVEAEKHKGIDKKINTNTNQITYLEGRIK